MLARRVVGGQCRVVAVGAAEGTLPLTERERAILDFEGSWWRDNERQEKRAAIRGALGISPSRYYALLSRLVERREAFSYAPLVVARLRRRRRARLAVLFGESPALRWQR